MVSVTVRVPESTHQRLRQLADARHVAIGEVVSELLEAYEQEKFWPDDERSTAEARANPALWQQMQEEQREFDGSLMDGLENEPWNDA